MFTTRVREPFEKPLRDLPERERDRLEKAGAGREGANQPRKPENEVRLRSL